MRTADICRQVAVVLGAVVAVIAAFLGSGAMGGTPISRAAGGALSADATLVAPGGSAFGIWSLLYVGFLALAVWHALPAQRDNPRMRQLGWLVALSFLLNAVWIGSVQWDRVGMSAVVILALLVTLAVIFQGCLRSHPGSGVEAVLVDGTLGLYLGWIVVATVANVAAALKAGDAGDLVLGAQPWAVVVLVGAALIGAALGVIGRGRIAAPAAVVWGLVWVAVARFGDAPESATVAGVAVAAAVVVVIATVVARTRRSGSAAPA